ncbi:methionine ABC transporter ATP-binding protein [Pseudoclavibacter sp. RFBI5]|uniref:methionine ABC transporter permease n=1 Tax=Pseudoclavibacter sp. RFBI5 TaxID=2080578 RepID=UPI000CE8A7EB|nr:methionine ABC transporter permease [Pseudoclavibacter sp. RFBI5]PPG04949.1 methionine ABC transporter ATP-binding protein [Pseudoclavibacter sp. RFBI5]
MELIDSIVSSLTGNADAIGQALAETGYMLVFSLAAAVVLGLPLGVLIYLTRPGGVREHRGLWRIANLYVTVVRSFPFLLFVVFLIPLTRLVFGTTFGTQAATFPLCFVGVAIYARLVEQILLEVPSGVIHAARSMGAGTGQIITRFLFVEARSGLVYALTSAAISLLSYSTVLGVVGGGGLGDFALRYGYQEYDYPLMYTTIVIVIVCVQLLQTGGHRLSVALDRR